LKVLGIDPGLRITGYAVISAEAGTSRANGIKLLEAGVIRTSARAGIAKRLKKVYDSLSELVDELRPDVLVLEKLYSHYNHPTTAILMGHARGAVCLLSGVKGVPLISIASTHVKKAVTGRGHAPKGQVQRMVQNYMGLKVLPEPPDVADALAVSLAYVFNKRK